MFASFKTTPTQRYFLRESLKTCAFNDEVDIKIGKGLSHPALTPNSTLGKFE